MKKAMYLLLVLLLVPTLLMAQTEGEFTTENMVIWLTPFIVLGVTWIIKKVGPIIPGWATILIVTGLSTAVAWVTTITIAPEAGFLSQVGLGLLSVFINQVYKQFKK